MQSQSFPNMIAKRGVPVTKLVLIILPIACTNASKLDRRSSMEIDQGLFQIPADFNAPPPIDLPE
jgi:hypothetical protein